ncbi:MAG: tetratricopeptide repeat protein [Treponemataceae bacterium]|nr:tetratricopeptide repeat protein [Treponemataceae bacterium]
MKHVFFKSVWLVLVVLEGAMGGFAQETGFTPQAPQQKPDALRSYRMGRDLEIQGRIDEANQRYEEAVQICKQEIAQNATNMDSYTVLTWALLRQKKYSDVLEWGAQGLRVNPNDYRVIETMGEAHFFLRNYDKCLEFMQRYISGAPQGERVSVAYFFMGEVYRLQKKWNHADMAYSMAVRLEPNMPIWWFRLGFVLETLNDFSNAQRAYERAVKLHPTFKDAQDGLERLRRRG